MQFVGPMAYYSIVGMGANVLCHRARHLNHEYGPIIQEFQSRSHSQLFGIAKRRIVHTQITRELHESTVTGSLLK